MASLIKRTWKNGPAWYIQYYVGNQQRRIRASDNFQIAKEKLRRFDAAQAAGDDLPLPTRTPIPDIVAAYVQHIRQVKTAKSAQTDIYYLRDMFGPVCDELKINSRKPSAKAKKKPVKAGVNARTKAPVIEADCMEAVRTNDITTFISAQVSRRGLAPKTANRYREILMRLFNWAMEQKNLRMPNDKNPAAKVERYKEPAPTIHFLTLKQIEEQLDALADQVKLQAMVATLIYAGLRREELLWLTPDDIDWSAGTFGLIRVRAKTIGDESWQPKTKVNRAVPISSSLRHYLDKWKLKSGKSVWLFPNSANGRYDPDNFSSDLRAFNENKELHWTCLHYRHTFGSQLAMKGESLYKISKMMGNSPEICRRHYAALIPEEMGDAVEFRPHQPTLVAQSRGESA
ncbi:MAG TPA: site-specific integrase [Bryobacteraceae bacterium]|nr:site-specific integrase [Bryobacteraceae bacterium]